MRIADYGVRNEKQAVMQIADCEGPTPNSTLHTPNSKGFTLIEIVMTIVIVSILAGIAAVIILQGVKAYTAEQPRSNVHYQARLAVERMAREVRVIRSATAADIQTWTAADLLFCDVTGRAVEFQLTGTSLNRRESPTCIPLAWGGWNALSSQISVANSSFVYFQQDGITAPLAVTAMWFVQITVTSTQGSETLQVRTRVHPMNF